MSTETRKPPTLKTIAEIVGLAVPTVSRALSNAPDIGEKTKRRVREVAKEIGYIPNRAGVRLKTGRTHVIALVISTDHGIVNRTARLISSSAGALRDTRYHLNVTPYFPTEDPLTPIRYIVENRSADAIILNQTEPEDVRVRYLLDHNFPFTTHGRTNWLDQHSYYDFDNLTFTRMSIEKIKSRGRKHALIIAPPMSQTYAQDIVRGAKEGGHSNDVKITVLATAHSDEDSSVISKAIRDAIEADSSIDAIFCASSPAAMSASAGIEATGKIVGDEVDVVGKETSQLLHLFRPNIVTYFEDITKAGRYLAKAAVNAVEHPDSKPHQFLQLPEFSEFATGQDILNSTL